LSTNVIIALGLATLAGLSTGIGSIIAYFLNKPKPQYISLILGFSAGVMLYVSFGELLHQALEKVGFLQANLGFFGGLAFIALLDIFVPHEYKQEHYSDSPVGTSSRKRKKPGNLIALGIAIHNLPEGMAVFSSAVTGNLTFGVLVAIAIALHNIPEGISVSIPITEATGNRKRAFWFSFASGLAEPLGALLAATILFPFLNDTVINFMLAFSAGIMVYISLDELLPTAHQYGKEHSVIMGVIAGMLIMAVSIYLLQ
jgi:zinc transporter, ZIP family